MKNENKKKLTIYDGKAIEFTANGQKMRIEFSTDEFIESPREDGRSNVAQFICWHRRHYLGDAHEFADMYDLLESLYTEQGLEEEYKKYSICDELIAGLEDCFYIQKLYIYDHSGIIITKERIDRWDSGFLGFAIISKDDAIKELGSSEETWRAAAEQCIDNELEEYNTFLSGEVYSYSLYKLNICYACGYEHEELIDSCCGFYGDDFFNNGMVEYVGEDIAEAIYKAENGSEVNA